MRIVILVGALVAAIAIAAPIAGKPVKPTITYAMVKPIFQKNCVSCHSGPKPAHQLNLSTYASIMKGDKEGKVVVPRHAKSSRLSKAIHRKGAAAMPPTAALPANQVALIDVWVNDGCPND